MPDAMITGSMLHDLVSCERRVHHDLHSDTTLRDPVNAFVELLWAGGREHEAEVFSGFGSSVVDLRDVPIGQRLAATLLALAGPDDIILGARLAHEDLLGMPDLLQRRGGVWISGDVKSGSPFAANGTRPRLEYAVQVAHYAGLLKALGLGSGEVAFVIGSDGEAVDYNLTIPYDRTGKSLAEITAALIEKARTIRDRSYSSAGALSAICKLCHWHTICEHQLVSAEDLTMIAGVGRTVRDAMASRMQSLQQLAHADIAALITSGDRTSIQGIGASRLNRFQHRARLLLTPGAKPYARRPLGLRRANRELHFDIEADPSRDGLVYLHGILDRRAGDQGPNGEYIYFFADGPTGERDAFAAVLDFLTADPTAMIYYYSKYERSSFRALQRKYPEVCSAEDIETLFDPRRAVDLLFDVIMPDTEWPTRNLSIKTLARHLGFDWRDSDASGASSIAWYDEWVRTGDPAVRRRIIDYNMDDVRASAVVLDGLIGLTVRQEPDWPVEGLS